MQGIGERSIQRILDIREMLKQQKIDYPNCFPSEFDDIIFDIEKKYM